MKNGQEAEFKPLQRLAFPAGHIDMVLDTNTYNEVDDQNLHNPNRRIRNGK